MSNTKSDGAENEKLAQVSEAITDRIFIRVGIDLFLYGWFSVSSGNPKTTIRRQTKKTVTVRKDGDSEVQAIIRSFSDLGLPGNADLKKLMALMRIVQEKNRGAVENPIRFTGYELLAKLGFDVRHNQTGGKHLKQIYEWLDRMANTSLKLVGEMTAEEKKHYGIKGGWRFIEEYSLSGEITDAGETTDFIEVRLTQRALQNLNHYKSVSINFDAFFSLKNDIAQLLVPLMQVWFYASNGAFTKSYADFCGLLNITQHGASSLIHRQLQPSFNELVEKGFLKKYEIIRNKSGSGFKIELKAGKNYTESLAFNKKFPLQIQGDDELLLQLPSRPEPDKEYLNINLNEENRKIHERLTALGMFSNLVEKLFVKFDTPTLLRRIAYAEKNLAQLQKTETVLNPGGFLYNNISATTNIPDNFKTAEEAAAELQDRETAEEEVNRQREAAYRLESAYEEYRRREAKRIYDALDDGEKKLLQEKLWQDIKITSPNYVRNFAGEEKEREAERLILFNIGNLDDSIRSFEQFLETDTEENLIKNFQPAVPVK